jgi:3-oxoacyl-[acyl-carrier protein] reductase
MSPDQGPLYGKVAVVTGGGRGIGRAIALGFAAAGADVCVLARTAREIKAVATQARRCGRRALALQCDVTDLHETEAAIEKAASQLGGIDVLVVNAGESGTRMRLGEDDPAAWEAVVRVHVQGAYHCIRAALPHLRVRGGGSVIAMGSGLGRQPQATGSAYSVGKAALWMLVRCLALELRDDNIAVNELIPGLVRTQATQDAFDDHGRPTNPLLAGEWAKEPEDVVPLALFLATQPRNGPTGQSYSLARRPL